MTSAPNRASATIRLSHLRGMQESASVFATRVRWPGQPRQGWLARRSAAPDPRIRPSSLARIDLDELSHDRRCVSRDIPCLGRAESAGVGPSLRHNPHVPAAWNWFIAQRVVTRLHGAGNSPTGNREPGHRSRRLSDRGHVAVPVTSNSLGRCRDASCASVHLTGDHNGEGTSGPKER